MAYGRSKTANILFAVEFDRRHNAQGIRATAVHPCGIQTELGRYMTPEVRQQLLKSGPKHRPYGVVVSRDANGAGRLVAQLA